MADIIQIRRGTASQWTTANPVLADGELGFETDTKKGKLGNGVTAWSSLPYSFTGESSNVAEQITAAAIKTVPVDADQFGITDSAASNVLKKLSWANIKAALSSLYAAATHTHSAADITSGTLAVARGGTGIASYTTGNYINASGATTLQQRTPAQVLSDIGAAASSHTHAASAITSGTFGSGNYVFPANVEIAGQIFSPIFAKGNSTGTINFNWNDANIQTIVLTGNCTFTFSNPSSGASYQIIISQDGTGGRTITWPTIHWEGKSAPLLTGTLNSKDIVTLTYDGTNYNGVISKNHGV